MHVCSGVVYGEEEGEGHRRGGREGHQMSKHSCFLGTNRPIGLAMVLAEKPEALMTNQK